MDDNEIEYGQLLFAVPLEKAPSRQTMSSKEVIVPSSSEATSVESSGTLEAAAFIIPSEILIWSESACVPWKEQIFPGLAPRYLALDEYFISKKPE